MIAVGLTVLAVASVWSGMMLDQRRGLLVTLLAVAFVLVLLGAITTLAAVPSDAETASPRRRTLEAAVPVVVVAVSAVLSTALFWISSARIALQ